MRSSGNTPSPTDRPVPLYLILAAEDHPRACTGRRRLRLGRVARARIGASTERAPVLLDPHAPVPLSRADAERAVRNGVLAVDCSWNRLRERGRYPDLGGAVPRGAPRRRLPFLLAKNPQHFGRVGELNTAEAFAAALLVLGRLGEAERLLAPFAGGPSFPSVNAAALVEYGQATTPEEIVAAEGRVYGPAASEGEPSRSARPRRRGAPAVPGRSRPRHSGAG